MTIPATIDYATFLANAQEADIRALAYIVGSSLIRTADAVEAETFQAQGDRLFDAGLLVRFRRSKEIQGDTVWFVFDGLVKPEAMNYVAQCAEERVQISREPV